MGAPSSVPPECASPTRTIPVPRVRWTFPRRKFAPSCRKHNSAMRSQCCTQWATRRPRPCSTRWTRPEERLIPRVKKLGIIVVENPSHFALADLFRRRFGPERAAVLQPFRSLLSAGIPLAIASDGGPGVPILNPYLNIMFAAYYPGKPNESLTREQAVIAYTRTAAYAECAESEKGTLEPGKFADLAVLSQDIFEVSPQALPKTESLLTIVGGKVAYNSGALVPSSPESVHADPTPREEAQSGPRNPHQGAALIKKLLPAAK